MGTALAVILHPANDVAPAATSMDDETLPRLIQNYSDSEEAQCGAREKSERDRDYVDNKQLTAEEIRKIEGRGQPAVIRNMIRTRARFLTGLEKKQRRDPKAWPRNNPEDVAGAEAFTSAMRYATEKADYASARSAAWSNVAVEGYGGVEVAAVTKRNGDVEFTTKRIPWDRIGYDPHSSEPDFSDSRYFYQVLWLDRAEAMARAVSNGKDKAEAEDILTGCLNSAPGLAKTYDDKPRWTIWADARRKRVRIVMMWEKGLDGWTYYEFTNAGILLESHAPYVDEDEESYCPWVLESANVDRENNRYGELRHLIDPQDEINKRLSKAVHQVNSRGVIAEEGAVADVNATRRELTKADFYIQLQPGAPRFEIVEGATLAPAQAALLQSAMSYIGDQSANDALRGTGATTSQSGRAIEAQQAGGLIEHGDLNDTLRRMDWRVFRILASMIKQKWTAEKWVRVTDDPDAPEWVGLNELLWVDPETGQIAPTSEWKKLSQQGADFGALEPVIDPQTGEQAKNNDVAKLDMDIIVTDAPDTVTLDGENFTAFTQLLTAGIPPLLLKLAIEMHPGLSGKRKNQLLDLVEKMTKPPEQPQGQSDAERLAKERVEAEIAETRSKTYKNLADGETKMASAYQQPLPMPDVAEGMTDAPQAPAQAPMGMPGMDQPPPMPQGPGGPPQMPPPGAQVGPMTGAPLAVLGQ